MLALCKVSAESSLHAWFKVDQIRPFGDYFPNNCLLESLRPTAADSRAVGPFYCFFVLFSILLDADASVSSGTHYLQQLICWIVDFLV